MLWCRRAVVRVTRRGGAAESSVAPQLQDLQEGQLNNLVCVTGEQVDVRNEELAELQAAAEVERDAFQQVLRMFCSVPTCDTVAGVSDRNAHVMTTSQAAESSSKFASFVACLQKGLGHAA
jgi:hypothetical protein